MKNLENMYENYIQFKNWKDFFSYTKQENKFYSQIFKNIKLQNKYFLDVGFGNGSLLKWSYDNHAKPVGIEIQKELINIGKNKKREMDILFFNNINKIKKIKFDVVALLNVLEHQEKKKIQTFLKKIHTSMRKDGVIVITVPNCQSPAGLANQFGDPTHVSMLSGPIVKDMLNNVGFKSVSYKSKPIQDSNLLAYRAVKKITLPIQFIFTFFYRITFSIKNVPLAADVIIYAKK